MLFIAATVIVFATDTWKEPVVQVTDGRLVVTVDPAEGPVIHDPDPIKVLFVGDIMLGRYVERLADANGWDSRFAEVVDDFARYDYVVANLEGPVTRVHVPTPDFSTTFSFTQESIEELKRSGVDAVSIANNHTYDFGEADYRNTQQVLDDAGFVQFGHPLVVGEDTSKVVTVEGHEIAFVGLHDVFGILDIDAAVAEVQRLSAETPDQDRLIVVSIHWGTEYSTTSNSRQQEFADLLTRAGADSIIGHHPHVRQEWAEVNESPVFYSLGNFLFDQYFSEEVEKGYAVELTIDGGEVIDYRVLDVSSTWSVPSILEPVLE